MGKVTNLTSHPRYHSHFRSQQLPECPEAKIHHELWDSQEKMGREGDPFDDLEPLESEPPSLEVGLSACCDCQHRLDSRSWWRRFFLPEKAGLPDLLCKAFPKPLVRNPVTGKLAPLGYLEPNPSFAEEGEPYMPCRTMNPIGTCAKFQLGPGRR